MPTYEYKCAACGQQMEAFQKMSDAPLTECPHCHQAALTKQVSAAGFQLKGSGWYVTDYSSKGKAKTKETNSGEQGSSSGTETKSQESTAKTDTTTNKSKSE